MLGKSRTCAVVPNANKSTTRIVVVKAVNDRMQARLAIYDSKKKRSMTEENKQGGFCFQILDRLGGCQFQKKLARWTSTKGGCRQKNETTDGFGVQALA